MSRTPSILVVEDSDIQREIIEMRLRKHEFEVDSCASGEECLEKVNNEETQYDLVLLDINMPGMNGLDALKKIRETHTSLALPVIMLTSEEDTKFIIEAFEIGANDYINKEVNFKNRLSSHADATPPPFSSTKSSQS